ncbi:DUF6049 family protein [Actinomycetospora lemnae]|uniref:DUF6049 family protein n=1 Tax=Actinomycetospora lemnae TaxID=3019891 RepID=A0ABT5T276_9PSEU|nr:DUF6049 family protein [Actinomycetospora sp. DW7H6]MDD7969224.1 DUF6049 family protein [Actinomycetospora sp. DW7H6]
MSPPRGPRGALRRPLALLAATVAGVLLVLVAPPAVAAPDAAPDAAARPAPVEVVLDGLAPRTVTTDGPGELVVTGRVTNRSAVPARDVGVRLARGPALSGSRAALTALETDGASGGAPGGAAVRTPSVEVAPTIAPGAAVPFTLRVPLTGPGSLALAAPGVHPLLVDVDGALGTAGPTRLDAVPFLLPVVGVPGQGPPAAPPVGQATAVAVLYPLADRPRRLPVVPGAPTLLTDDDLATSLAPGGRLAGLVDALGRAAPAGSAAARSVCLAVDADLLETASAMTGGYQVRTATGGTTAGTGAAAADRWLDAVRAQARGRCVVALPYAGTDLVATAHGDRPDLTAAAVATGTRRVGDLLGVTPVAGTVWPAGGLVDERTVTALTAQGARALLLDGDLLDGRLPAGALARLPGAAGSAPAAVALDPVAATALAPRPAAEPGDATSPAGTAAPLAVQDALGVLGLRALQEPPADGAPAVEVVAPPTDWAASTDEAAALLAGVDELARLGLARPVDLATLVGPVGAATPLAPTALASPEREIDGVAPPGLVARAGVVRDRQGELLAATERDGVGAPSPSDFVEPLTDGVLRSLSAAWRGDPAVQEAQVAAVERQVDELRSLVRVAQPSGSYSLGSNDAPLLLTVENRLPVAVRVQVVLEPTPGLRTASLPVVTVPAFGSRQVQVEVEVTRAGQFAVDAQAQTPGGEPLGPTARLLLRSTAYGTITVWLTASAAVVLVILASVRIARRVRAARRDQRSRRRRHRDPGTTTDADLPTRELQRR